MRWYATNVLVLSCFLGCGDSDAAIDDDAASADMSSVVQERIDELGIDEGDAVRPEELVAGQGGLTPVSLCHVAWMFDGGSGRYRVSSMTSLPEPWEPGGFDREVTTYVELQLLDGWSPGAPEDLVLRIPGGEIPSMGLSAPAHAGFSLDEDVGVFWTNDTRIELPNINRGWPYTQDYAVFRDAMDRGLFSAEGVMLDPMSPTELGALVREVYESFPVPFPELVEQSIDDVPEERCPSEARDPR